MKTKILILKLGYSETLDPEISIIPSLGDVLRTTPILWALKEKYPDSEITWLVDKQAELLLRGNKFIDRLLVWDDFVPFQLMKEKFDVLINLEKIPGICALADMIEAWVKYGFRLDTITGRYHAYERGLKFLDYIERKKTTDNRDFWQKVLIEMLGVKWKEQEYIIGYRPRTRETHDVGLNYMVGYKWEYKAMPRERWDHLERKLNARDFKVSWQQGADNLYDYMDWINSCRLIVSNDSLGLHIALAFKKKVIGLFGPTDSKEIYFYDRGKSLRTSARCEHMPCYQRNCLSDLKCMSSMSIDKIVEATKGLIR